MLKYRFLLGILLRAFYINLCILFLSPGCENIFKIVCIDSEKTGKKISKFDILFLVSIRIFLQFQWKWKNFSGAVPRLCGQLLMAPWHGFHLFDKEMIIWLIPPRKTSPWFANFSPISAAICLLFKIFCQNNKFVYFKSISSFPTSACPEHFRIFVTIMWFKYYLLKFSTRGT